MIFITLAKQKDKATWRWCGCNKTCRSAYEYKILYIYIYIYNCAFVGVYNKKFLQKLAESKTSSEFVSREFFLKRNWIPQKGQHHRSLRGDAAL